MCTLDFSRSEAAAGDHSSASSRNDAFAETVARPVAQALVSAYAQVRGSSSDAQADAITDSSVSVPVDTASATSSSSTSGDAVASGSTDAFTDSGPATPGASTDEESPAQPISVPGGTIQVGISERAVVNGNIFSLSEANRR